MHISNLFVTKMSNLFPSNILEEAVKCVIYFPLGIEIAANNVTKMFNF